MTDVKALSGLTNLEELWLDKSNMNEKIEDITHLADLVNIKELMLGKNAPSDIKAVSRMSELRKIDITSNKNIKDLSPLEGKSNLREVYAGDNDISDISVLKNAAKLSKVNLDKNHIADLSALGGKTLTIFSAKDQKVEVTAKKGQAENPLKARDGSAVTDFSGFNNLKFENGKLVLIDKTKEGSAEFTAENGKFTGKITVKPAAAYTVKVNNGKADQASYEAGEKVTLTADKAAVGKELAGREVNSGDVQIADDGTFTMPAGDVEVTALYSDIEYKVTVKGGKADPEKCVKDTVVTIVADKAPKGKVFDKWIVKGDAVKLADPDSEKTTFTMPASDVEIEAVYKDKVNDDGQGPANNKPNNGGKASTVTKTAHGIYTGDTGMFTMILSISALIVAAISLAWISRKKKFNK